MIENSHKVCMATCLGENAKFRRTRTSAFMHTAHINVALNEFLHLFAANIGQHKMRIFAFVSHRPIYCAYSLSYCLFGILYQRRIHRCLP